MDTSAVLDKAEWRKRLAAAHPDRGGDPEAFIALMADRAKQDPKCQWCGKPFPQRGPENHSSLGGKGKPMRYCNRWCANQATTKKLKGPPKLKPSRRQSAIDREIAHLEQRLARLEVVRRDIGDELFVLRCQLRFGAEYQFSTECYLDRE